MNETVWPILYWLIREISCWHHHYHRRAEVAMYSCGMPHLYEWICCRCKKVRLEKHDWLIIGKSKAVWPHEEAQHAREMAEKNRA